MFNFVFHAILLKIIENSNFFGMAESAILIFFKTFMILDVAQCSRINRALPPWQSPSSFRRKNT